MCVRVCVKRKIHKVKLDTTEHVRHDRPLYARGNFVYLSEMTCKHGRRLRVNCMKGGKGISGCLSTSDMKPVSAGVKNEAALSCPALD